MQVLWNEPNLTLGEIKQRLDESITWDKTTINTLLRRLKAKGIIDVIEARHYKYFALYSENECLQDEMNSILEKFFYSSPTNLIATLAKSEKFNKENINELEDIIAEIKEMNE